MKAKIFTLLAFFSLSSLAMAVDNPGIVIANFETVSPFNINIGWGAITDPEGYAVVDNPLIDQTNPTPKCIKLVLKESWRPLSNPDNTSHIFTFPTTDSLRFDKKGPNHYLHVRFLSNTLAQRFSFGLTQKAGKYFSLPYTVSQAELGKWVDAVFDLNIDANMYTAFSSFSIACDKDFTKNARTSITTYIDEIVINNVATKMVFPLPEKTLANFETVTPVVNAAWGNITDPAAVNVVDNPAPDATNSTTKCLKVLQKATYQPWANGDLYCAVLPMSPIVAFDNTNASHFLHFKYLSNKVGATINVELADNAANLFDYPITVTTTGKWVEAVIDLSVAGYTLANISEVDLSPNNTYQTNKHTADEITYFDEVKINNISIIGVNTAVSTVSTDNISVFPSLAREVLNISGISVKTTASIYNLNGKLVQTKELANGANQLSITNLTNGIYIVKLQTENNTIAKKFVKQ
jgi:hypothetical protein